MKIFKSSLLSVLLSLWASPIFAIETDGGGGGGDVELGVTNGGEPPRIAGIATVLDEVMGYIFPVAAVVCVIFIIIGGYMWIASAGDPSKVKQAQGTLTWAIIGLIFVMIVRLIVGIVLNAL